MKTPYDFSQLSIEERVLLAQSIWDGLYEEAQSLEISEALKQELESRLEGIRDGSNPSVTWEDVKHRLKSTP